MPILRNLLLSVAVLSAGFSLPALSQSTEADPPAQDEPVSGESSAEADRKQYLVEVITFRYLGPDTSGGETFDQLLVEDYLPLPPFDFDENNRIRETVSYTGMQVLSGALERLRLDDRYQVLTNIAWVQPLLGKNNAVDIPVGHESRTAGAFGRTSGQTIPAGSASEGLSGTLRVYGDYLLFAELDMKIALPARPDDGSVPATTETGFTTIIGGSQNSRSALEDGVEVFHLSEKRRIKLEEFHYFDHPFFGAIVSVVRHQES